MCGSKILASSSEASREGVPRVCLLVTIGVAFAFGMSAGAQQSATELGGASCSNRTLFGDYGVQIEGILLAPNWTLRTVAMVRFNGDGTFTYVHYRVVNGTPVTPDWVSDSGTYSVSANCTATAVFGGPIPVHLVVANNDKDFRGVVDGEAITLVGSRVH
jgi:hypothetical protein